MKITIFGATDLLGKYLVRQALALENEVYAFGRNVFTSGFPNKDTLHLLQGTLFDEQQVFNAIKDSEVVIAVINPPSDEYDKSRSLGIKNIVKQMEKAGMKRLIAVGSIVIKDDESGDFIMEDPDFPKEDIETGKQDYQMLQALKDSDLDWTYVGLPKMLDEDVTGIYSTSKGSLPLNFAGTIKAGDAGLFILNELNKSENLKLRVAVYN